jgi:hypothetical protein
MSYDDASPGPPPGLKPTGPWLAPLVGISVFVVVAQRLPTATIAAALLLLACVIRGTWFTVAYLANMRRVPELTLHIHLGMGLNLGGITILLLLRELWWGG